MKYAFSATPICCIRAWQLIAALPSRRPFPTGTIMASSTAIMPSTTSNSTSVKPLLLTRIVIFSGRWYAQATLLVKHKAINALPHSPVPSCRFMRIQASPLTGRVGWTTADSSVCTNPTRSSAACPLMSATTRACAPIRPARRLSPPTGSRRCDDTRNAAV